MNILIVYPKFPTPFWSFTNTSKLVSEKKTFSPKDLLIISILLPITWERKLIDLNTDKLKKKDIRWADYILISAKEEQHNSTIKTIKKCNSLSTKIIASGALFTEYWEEFKNVEHWVLDDIRITLPLLINDLEEEKPKKVYHSNPFFEIRRFTESYYSLTGISGNFSQNIQLSHV